MQDLRTGAMVPLDVKDHSEESIQSAKDVIAAMEHQGPVFFTGEILDIKGGKFRIKSIGQRIMMLESLPGNTPTVIRKK